MTELVDGQTLVCELAGARTRGHPVAICRLCGQDVGASKGRYAQLEQPAARTLPFPAYCTPR